MCVYIICVCILVCVSVYVCMFCVLVLPMLGEINTIMTIKSIMASVCCIENGEKVHFFYGNVTLKIRIYFIYQSKRKRSKVAVAES